MSDVVASIVVPCYNEASGIRDTIERLDRVMSSGALCQLVVVEDGSTDGTWEILESIAASRSDILLVRHPTNLGYGAALKTGIRSARGQFIVIADADGSYPLEMIPELLRQGRECDMVVGARIGESVHYPWLRRVPKFFLVRYSSWVAGRPIPDINSGLRVFRKSVAERFMTILPNRFSFTTTITLALITNHYNVRFVPINYAPRLGKSKIHPVRDTLNLLQLIVRTGMYFAPLRVLMPIAGLLGLAFLASLAYDTFALRNLTDKTVILLMFTMNISIFALLADMIDKRAG